MGDLTESSAVNGALSMYSAPGLVQPPLTIEQQLAALRMDVEALKASLAKLALNTHNQVWTGAGCPPQGVFTKAPGLSEAPQVSTSSEHAELMDLQAQLAYEQARDNLENFGEREVIPGGKYHGEWFRSPDHADDLEPGDNYFARGVRYLTAINLLEAHPTCRDWFRAKDRP